MGQIMALAQSLSGGGPRTEPGNEAPEKSGEQGGPSDGSVPDLSSLLGSLDPKLVRAGLNLLQGDREQEARGAALLQALRPFLREERQSRLDRVLQMANTTRLIRRAMGLMSGEEAGDV